MAFKQRKFRNKVTTEDEDGEDGLLAIRPPQHQPKKEPAAAAGKPPPGASSLRASRGDAKKDSKGSKLNLLSFEDEGDDPGFVPKKDSKKDKQRQSKLGRAPPLPDLPTELAAQTLRSTAGEYTAERLKELQRNAISFSANKLAASNGAEAGGGPGSGAAGSEPVIKLSGSFKPAGAAKDDRFTLPGSSIALVKPEEESMPLPPPPRPGGPGPPPAAQPTGGPGDGANAAAAEEEDDDMGIPDEHTILAAKAKRERLRQAHLAPDYIPLHGMGLSMGRLRGAGGLRSGSAGPGASGSGAEGGAGSGSDSGEDAAEMMRIRFTGKEGARPRKDLGQLNRVVGGDDDEEAFAQEQLRKALRLQQVGGAGTAPTTAGPGPGSAAAVGGAGGGFPPPAGGVAPSGGGAGPVAYPGAYAPAGPGPGSGAAVAAAAFAGGGMGMAAGGSRLAAIAAAGDAVVSSLVEGLRRMQTSRGQMQQNAKRTADHLAASLGRVEGLEGELRCAGDKYLYLQKLRAYVADLCDCLQVKSAIVEELEDTRLELMEDRASAARSAASNGERDLLAPAEAAMAAAMAVLGRGAGVAAASAAAESAARDTEDRLLDEEGPEELDEFGRNVNLQKRRELEERAAARKRLLALEGERLAAAMRGGEIRPLVTEGEPGDDQSSRYAQRYREVVEAGATVFADTDEEFASIGAVKQRLEEWKARYPKDYTNAYMYLSTPALFAPYVRLQLLRWDPLYGAEEGTSYKGFDSQDWYGELFEYGMTPDAMTSSAGDDPDSDLVPQLVRKLVLPLALHWIERCWNVRNVAHTRAVAALASELLVYVPAEEERMVALLSGLRGSLEAAVEGCSLPPWPPALLACSPLAARVLFHRFRIALRLLHCVSAFQGLLARSLLTGLALGRLVSGHMMPYLRGTAAGGEGGLAFAVAAAEAVAAALHPDWFAEGTVPEGAVFLEHVVGLGRALEQAGPQTVRGGPGEAALGRGALAGRVAKVLARLGDFDRGARLAATFGVQGT